MNFLKRISSSRVIFLMIMTIVIIGLACKPKKTAKSEFCTEEDFKAMTKIDIHCHISVERHAFMEQAVEYNFRILTINTDAYDDLKQTIEEQEKMAILQKNAFPGHLAFVTAFSMVGWDNEDWQQKTISSLEESFRKGAIGVKVWKNIGMVTRDKNGKFIMIDNPKFDPIFDYIEKKGMSVCGHLGEPKNCWLPLDEMTVNNDRKYFKEHPEYHMYLHPDFPSYENQIEAIDNMLKKHPNLRFMGAHLGSLEWSVDELAKHFDMFPNSSVDMAARICHIEKQTEENWQKVHDFFIKYQDRIIYGTDEGDWIGAEPDPVKLKEDVLTVWKRDWKFLTTDERMTSWEVNGKFKGLKLPKEVIEKIYYINAMKWFPGV
jgi:predicted TIM-barrel fold metal-dependent hydrolase